MTDPEIHGQAVRMSRNFMFPGVALTNLLATTQVVDLRGTSGGSVWIPAGGPTSLAVYCSPDPTGVTYIFQRYRDKNQNEVTWTLTAGTENEYPDNVFGMSYTKFVILAGSNATCFFYCIG